VHIGQNVQPGRCAVSLADTERVCVWGGGGRKYCYWHRHTVGCGQPHAPRSDYPGLVHATARGVIAAEAGVRAGRGYGSVHVVCSESSQVLDALKLTRVVVYDAACAAGMQWTPREWCV
jgi:hypothetical protein